MDINTNITINQIIESFIYFTANVSTFWILFRQWLRFSVKKTLGLAAIFVFIDVASALLLSFGSGWILSIIFLVDAAAEIQLVKWGYRRKACILYEVQCLLFNILGIAIIAVLTAFYGILMGEDSQTWFLDETATQADYIIKYIGMIIGYVVSFLITKKCISLLEYLTEKEVWLFSVGLVGLHMLFTFVTRTFMEDSSQYMSGLFVTLYGIFNVGMALLGVLTLILPLLRLRRENWKLRTQMEEQYVYYRKVMETQQMLREIRHDLKNRLVVEAVAGAKPESERKSEIYVEKTKKHLT